MNVGLAGRVHRAFYGRFPTLRSAQADAIAPVLGGHDTVVLAGTGSGKTEAVLAPLIQRHLSVPAPLTVLYICPTRALANDMLRRLELPLRALSLSVGVRHGEQDDLRRKELPDVVITTPESLDVLLWRGLEALAGVRAVVLDEAHLLYNTQRGMQTTVLLRRLERAISAQRLQVCAMSATVSSVPDLWEFFRPGCEAVEVASDDRREIDLLINVGSDPSELAGLLERTLADRKALVFANSRGECDRVATELRDRPRLAELLYAHHASLSKESRLNAEREFSRRRSAVCVSTSTLELGIDIGDIDLVALWSPPSGWPSYLQRIGRGNRRSQRCQVLGVVPERGEASLWPTLRFEALARQVAEGRLDAPAPLPLFGAIGQQVATKVHAAGGGYLRFADLLDELGFIRHVDENHLDHVLDGLVAHQVLTAHPHLRRVGAGDELHRLRDMLLLWSNFPLRSSEIDVVGPAGDLGTVPGTNILALRPGAVFVLGRDRLRVEATSLGRVLVRPTKDPATTRVRYGGLPSPLDVGLVDEVRRCVADGIEFDHVNGLGDRRMLLEMCQPVRRALADGSVPQSEGDGGLLHATFAGVGFNRLLARRFGGAPDACDEVFLSAPSANWRSLPESLEELCDVELASDADTDLTLYQQFLPSRLSALEAEAAFIRHPRNQEILRRLRHAKSSDVSWPELRPLRVGTATKKRSSK